MTEDKIINELTKIKGVNKKSAIKLFRAGIKSIKKLGSSNPDELSRITGIAKKQLTTWIILARAQERKKFIEVDTAASELSQLIDMKLEDAQHLVSAGVMSLDDLADESADLLSEDTGISADLIQKWIKRAKEVRKLPPEKRKVVIVPSAEGTLGSKFSGAFFGSSSGLNNIYNDPKSFRQSLFFVILSSILLAFYLSTFQGTIFGLEFTKLWEATQISSTWPILEEGVVGNSLCVMSNSIQITFYPVVFIGGVLIIMVIWLLLGKIISRLRNLEFKNMSAVLGFALAPAIFIAIVIVGKFIPAMRILLFEISGLQFYLLTILLIIFGAWVLITFIRSMAFSPRVAPIPSGAPEAMPMLVTKKPPAETTLEVVEERAPIRLPPPPTPVTAYPSTPPTPPLAAPPAYPPAAPPTAPAPPPAEKLGPTKLDNFGIIPPNEVTLLQNAGFYTSMDLLRANSKEISGKTGIPQSKIIIWRIISDLLRIPGISLEYAMILAKSGVRSVKHLSKINENALKVQVLDTISKEAIPSTITANMLSDWIKKAKTI